LNYHSYLKLGELLSLQSPLTKSEHEPYFIITHQIIELWFKVILEKNLHTIQLMLDGQTSEIPNRITWSTDKIDRASMTISSLEDMTPEEFTGFRSALGSASGAQSHQFKELEIQGGLKNEDVLARYRTEAAKSDDIRVRFSLPTFRTALQKMVEGLRLVHLAVLPAAEGENLGQTLSKCYADSRFSALREIMDALYEYDRAFKELRERHLKVVRKVIGALPGTGGTSGAKFLEGRLKDQFFPEISKIVDEFRSRES
jgi:tryptophan 2,3-dioxygenase